MEAMLDSIVNKMEFFSWETSDTKKSIPNRYSGQEIRTVKMIDVYGNEWIEYNYEGFGRFGGMDYYELMAIINGYTESETESDFEAISGRKPIRVPGLRDIGIELAFNKELKDSLRFPKLVEEGCTIPYRELPNSKICKAQGYSYD